MIIMYKKITKKINFYWLLETYYFILLEKLFYVCLTCAVAFKVYKYICMD